jgi:hypothetical protein
MGFTNIISDGNGLIAIAYTKDASSYTLSLPQIDNEASVNKSHLELGRAHTHAILVETENFHPTIEKREDLHPIDVLDLTKGVPNNSDYPCLPGIRLE